MEQYQVDYLINVQADAATKSLTSFAQAMGRVKGLDTRLANLARSAETLTTALNQLPKNGYRIKVTIPEKTTQAINTLRTQLQNLKKLATAPMTVKINTANALRSLQTLETRVTRLSTKMKSIGIGSIGAVAPTPGAPIGRGGSLTYTPIASQRFTPAQIRQAYGRQIGPMRGQTANIGGRNVPVWGAAPAGMMGPGGYLSYAPQNNSRISTQNSQQRKQQAGQTSGSSTGSGQTPDPTRDPYARSRSRSTRRRTPASAAVFGRVNGRYSANALGHAEIVNPMALNMLKGMGIAYGLSGIMSLTGGVIRDATEYNNMMQTAKNILQSNDNRPNFANRVKGMESVVRQIGISTKFTAPETADAARYLAMAGLDLETIKTAMPSIADLALIGDSDLGATADVVTNIMTAYGITPRQMRNTADVMARTFTMSNTTLMEIAESYKYAASLLSAANIPFVESAGAIGVLGNAGIKASQAGTTLRTILNNIVKPTKSQKDMWLQLGIKRFKDEDEKGESATGEMRSLLDIFTDLNRKHVPVQTYYKLFRLTAAQGATALAMNVDTWRDITENNGMAGGLSRQLAEAKKNTVQGLWAQLTSSFTEQGIRAFEGKQSSIVDILKRLTAVLQSSRAEDTIKNITDRLWGLGEAVADFSKVIGKAFSVMAGPIDGFLRIELWAGALAILARSLKSIANVGGMGMSWLRQMGNSSVERVAAIQAFRGRYNTARDRQHTWSQMPFGWTRASRIAKYDDQTFKAMGYTDAQIKQLKSGKYVYAPGRRAPKRQGQLGKAWIPNANQVWQKHQATYNSRTRAHLERRQQYLNKILGGNVAAGIGLTAGGATLGALGGMLGAEMFENNPVGSFVGAATLGTVGYMLPSMLSGAGMALAAVGSITAVLAVLAGLGLHLHHVNERAREATKSMEQFAASVQLSNGVNVSDSTDYLAQHMAIIASTTDLANQKLTKHIELLQKELGLEVPPETSNFDPWQSYSDISSERSKNLSAQVRMNWFASTPQVWDSIQKDSRFASSAQINEVLAHIHGTGGYDYQSHIITKPDAKRIMIYQALLSEANAFAGGKIQEFESRIAVAKPEEVADILKEMQVLYGFYSNIHESAVIPSISNAKSGQFVPAQYSAFNDEVANQLGAAGRRLSAYGAYYKYHTPEAANMLLQALGIYTTDTSATNGVMPGTPEWYVGWSDLFRHKGVNAKTAWNEQYTTAVSQIQSNVYEAEQGKLLAYVRRLFGPVVPEAYRPQNGYEEEMDGLMRVYNAEKDTWTLKSGQGPSTAPVDIPYNDHPVANTAVDSSDMASEYSSAYESASASPKQVVINIESLMNVDAVNMGDPDVENTLANLRESMATVLMGVVSDFTQQYQNS